MGGSVLPVFTCLPRIRSAPGRHGPCRESFAVCIDGRSAGSARVGLRGRSALAATRGGGQGGAAGCRGLCPGRSPAGSRRPPPARLGRFHLVAGPLPPGRFHAPRRPAVGAAPGPDDLGAAPPAPAGATHAAGRPASRSAPTRTTAPSPAQRPARSPRLTTPCPAGIWPWRKGHGSLWPCRRRLASVPPSRVPLVASRLWVRVACSRHAYDRHAVRNFAIECAQL
jgi:hypothetical protein